MNKIPDDVMKAAGDAILKGGCTLKIGDAMHVSIARAIMAERERCAKVADSRPNAHHTAIRYAILHPK